jgi:hypothetical protein
MCLTCCPRLEEKKRALNVSVVYVIGRFSEDHERTSWQRLQALSSSRLAGASIYNERLNYKYVFINLHIVNSKAIPVTGRGGP